MAEIRVTTLGAGQDVGRSCIVVSLGGRTVMFDCGMHMGFQDARRFPDFSLLSASGDFDGVLDAVIVSHFHLDHCGALPFFTEVRGFRGPVIMTHPTKAICPVLLEDFRRLVVERRGGASRRGQRARSGANDNENDEAGGDEEAEAGEAEGGPRDFFTSEHIAACMKKVRAVSVNETLTLAPDFEVRAYYAGHVLGAAMFHVRVGAQSVVYTGDFNTTPDRHLGAAWIDRCEPDLLITESTYATTVRDSRRAREQGFLRRVKECVDRGGKVLIPVFALGRAQELCILLDGFWSQLGMRAPIYFSKGLSARGTDYYKLFIGWTNEQVKRVFVERNRFDFKHIAAFERWHAKQPGPMVVFATPGMLHAGLSLDLFRQWAEDPRNLVILPGYCVAGTVGHRVLAGEREVQIDARTRVTVRCEIANLSFSAHADAKGILQLIQQARPRHVMLVHGEKAKMEALRRRVEGELGIPCIHPPNGSTVAVPGRRVARAAVSRALLSRALAEAHARGATEAEPQPPPLERDEEATAAALAWAARAKRMMEEEEEEEEEDIEEEEEEEEEDIEGGEDPPADKDQEDPRKPQEPVAAKSPRKPPQPVRAVEVECVAAEGADGEWALLEPEEALWRSGAEPRVLSFGSSRPLSERLAALPEQAVLDVLEGVLRPALGAVERRAARVASGSLEVWVSGGAVEMEWWATDEDAAMAAEAALVAARAVK